MGFSLMDVFNGALTFNQNMFAALRDSAQPVRHGFMVVFLVGLLVGGVNGVRSALLALDPQQAIVQQQSLLKQGSEELLVSVQEPQVRASFVQVMQLLEAQFQVYEQVVILPTTLPPAINALANGLHIFVTTPLSYLGSMLLVVLLTHLAARQLGGQGTLQQMVGLGALSVAPHALDALGFIPLLGSTLGILAWLWGFALLVYATRIAHRLENERALFAVFIYPFAGLIITLISCCGLFILVNLLGSLVA